jgi:FkbM family methyltransferase
LSAEGGPLRRRVIPNVLRTLAYARRSQRLRRSPLDPGGILATALASQPLSAMDVGAAGGVSEHWREYLPVMTVDCFEPDVAECAARQRASPANVRWHAVALAGASGRRSFHVLNRSTGSSLYPPNQVVMEQYSGPSYAGLRRVVELECLSLDDFLVQHNRPVPSLLKLDTQGSELEILSSLKSALLDQITCVEVEVEFLELYLGQPTFSDIHVFMQASGFRLLDLRTHRSYRNAGDQPQYYLRRYLNTASGSSALSAELVAGDALYIREPDPGRPGMSKSLLMTYLCILRMYRFYDLCFWLVDRAAHVEMITESERLRLMRDVAYGAPRPRLRQRPGTMGGSIAKLLWALGMDDYEVFWTRRAWPDQ